MKYELQIVSVNYERAVQKLTKAEYTDNLETTDAEENSTKRRYSKIFGKSTNLTLIIIGICNTCNILVN